MDASPSSKLLIRKIVNEVLTSCSNVLGLYLLLASSYSEWKLKMLNSLDTAIDLETALVCYFILSLDKNILKFSCDVSRIS